MSYIPHFLVVPWTQNITLGLDPTTLARRKKISWIRLLNVILLPGCFVKTFIDIMFFFTAMLFYVFTFLFNTYRLLFTVITFNKL